MSESKHAIKFQNVVSDAPASAVKHRFGRTALVTVLYNSAEVLPEFLDCLSLQTDTSWSLIVIDNASSDSGVRQVEAWAGPVHAMIRNTENLGFSKATNQGIAVALAGEFEAVVLLNNDTTFGDNFLSGLLQSPHRVDAPILTPVIYYEGEHDRLWFAQGKFTPWRGGFQSRMLEHPPVGPEGVPESWLTDFVPGCAKLISRAAIQRIGLLDEQFFVYWEDADYCWRCKEAGMPLRVLRDVKILHKVSALTRGSDSPFSIQMYHINQIRFLRKHFGEWGTWLQVPSILAKCTARLLTRRDRLSQSFRRFRTVLVELASGSGV